MNKNYFKILLCIVLIVTLFGGCAKKKEPAAPPETTVTENGKQPSIEAPEVTLNVWNDEKNTDDDGDEKTDAQARVSISFPDEELLSRPQDFTEFIADDTEYQVKVALSTDIAVTNFRVLSLNIDNVNEEGAMVFSENELYTLERLTPEKPLVVGMVFIGDIPNMGISYVDANGMERVYAIALSGQNGQPLLEEAELTHN